ncbi:MAG: hypothetical protein AAGC70_06320 [Pseudomonadota bacterium]
MSELELVNVHHQCAASASERARVAWRRTVGIILAASAAIASAPAAAADFVDLPRDLEIELALSALPEDLQAKATIYVRDPQKGFVVHRSGSNGWSTFVARTSVRFYEADWAYAYPTDQLIPQAHDRTGMTHNVVPYFDLEKLRIDGVSAKRAKHIIRKRFKDGTYTAPPRGGFSYMLAPIHRAYLAPAESGKVFTTSFPHHMPYAPHMPTRNLGMMDPKHRSGTLDHGGHDTGPHGYLYFMVQPDQAKAIRARYAALLKRLCDHHANWCLPKAR